MSFTKLEENISVHQGMSDYPNQDMGMSADELKKKLDYPAETLKEAFNQLIDELVNSSASNSLGAGKMGTNDNSDNNIDAKLRYLYDSISNVALGQIPDNTITQAKMESNYDATLAKKDGTLQSNLNAEKLSGYTLNDIGLKNKALQVGLNAEMVGGETLAQILEHKNYVFGTYTGVYDNGHVESTTNPKSQTISVGFTPSIVMVFRYSTAVNRESDIFVTFENFTTPYLTIIENGFSVSDDELNSKKSYKYGYIALK